MGIRGEQIKDNSIQSVDIQDGTLSFADMSSTFTWKEPVANAAALPTGTAGDVTVTLDDGSIHVKSSSTWEVTNTGDLQAQIDALASGTSATLIGSYHYFPYYEDLSAYGLLSFAFDNAVSQANYPALYAKVH